MTSKEYWDNRAAKRLIEAEKQSNDYIKKVKKIYSKANNDIKKELANVYKNYSKETGVDVHTLKNLLSKEETDEFWKTLKGQGLKKYVQANYKSRINRLEQIQGQLYAKAKEIYKEELNTVYGHYRSVINESYNKTIYDYTPYIVQSREMKKVGIKIKQDLLSYLEIRDIYELVNLDDLGENMKNRMVEGQKILSKLNQYKYSPLTKEEMTTLFDDIKEVK